MLGRFTSLCFRQKENKGSPPAAHSFNVIYFTGINPSELRINTLFELPLMH